MPNFLPIVSTPLTEVWTMWTMLALLVCGVLSIAGQPGFLLVAFRGVFTKMERTYSDAGRSWMNVIGCTIFRVGVLAMALYVFFFESGDFVMWRYWVLVLLILGLELLRWGCSMAVTYVFGLRQGLDESRAYYDNLWLVSSVILYPVTLLMINWGIGTGGWIAMCSLFLFFLITLTVRLFRVYVVKWTSVIYILLYVVTLEVLPIIGLCIAIEAWL